MSKAFIITIDTEGDNLWNWEEGAPISTENAKYIPRFQELCEKYGFKPVYLTNYEMAQNDEWVKYAKSKESMGLCEIGMHIHAWNSPPEYPLARTFSGNPYITEYPAEIIEDKISNLTHYLENRFEIKMVSARSGRWATNDDYFKSLKSCDYKVDCSMTPDLDLSTIHGATVAGGNDYRAIKRYPHCLPSGIIEVPMTTKKIRHWANGSFKHSVASMLRGDRLWLRPHRKSFDELVLLSKSVDQEKNGYLEFMMHSSELMPGGSPYFKSAEEVEKLYEVLNQYFAWIANNGYSGETLYHYVEHHEIK